MRYSSILLTLLATSLCVSFAQAGTLVGTSVDFDRWNYPFNASPGIRSSAPTFFDSQNASFDNFDGQFLVGFNTAAAGVTPLGPGKMYKR